MARYRSSSPPSRVDREHLLLLAAQHGQHAVRWHGRQRLGEIEVIPKLRRRRTGSPPSKTPMSHRPLLPEPFPQRADQFGVFSRALGDDVPGTLQRRGGVGDAPGARRTRRPRRRAPAPGRPAAGRPAAPARLPWRSALWSVAWVCTAGRCPPHGPWCRRPAVRAASSSVSLPCSLIDASTAVRRSSSSRRYPRRSSRVAQLPVVEAAGHLLAVAGDERDGRALVEQPHRGSDLALAHCQFLSETGVHRFDGARFHPQDPTERR